VWIELPLNPPEGEGRISSVFRRTVVMPVSCLNLAAIRLCSRSFTAVNVTDISCFALAATIGYAMSARINISVIC
jgi:hypothetical protein